jgi:outer membrane protein assembly factor BamB
MQSRNSLRPEFRIAVLLAALAVGDACLPCFFGRAEEPGTPSAPPKAKDANTSTMFGGTPSRNLVNTVDKNIPDDWSIENGKEKNLKWVAKLGNRAYGGPVIAGGRVFVATNNANPRNPNIKGDKGVIMCFRESDGTFLWQALHDLAKGINPEAMPEGIASTPAVEGNRVYYVSNGCEVVCLDTEGTPDGKGKVVWWLDMMKELDVYPHKMSNGSPLIAGDLVIVCTSNGVNDDNKVQSPKAPSLIAIDKNTGKVKWQDNSPGDKIVLGQWSNPAYALIKGKGQVIFGGGDGWLRAFEAETGKPLWRFNCNTRAARAGAKGDRNYLVSTPVVYDNKVYIGTGQEPSLGSGPADFWCIDPTKTGDVSPEDETGAANKNSAVVWHYGDAVDAQTEEITGRKYAFGRTVSTAAVVNDLVYIAEVAGFFHCLDAKTGKPQWLFDAKAEVWGSPYCVDNKVFLGTGDGEVHVFAAGKEKKALGKIEMDSGIFTAPVAANGVLYVMTSKNLYSITKK